MNTPPIRLLLADDDQDDCLIFQDALEEIPLAVQLTVVNDGEQLIHYLEKKKEELPSVLFLDLNMPRKNGFECLVEIKGNAALKTLPVIIYSTSLNGETAEVLHQHGARYYIRKPADFSQLKRVIHHALNLIAQQAPERSGQDDFVLQP